jgi:hypothetical protein
MVNSHDPHRPFHVPGKKYGESEEPSRTYAPSEVEVPGFVPDLPGVREELSYYQNSVRRCDDTFGRVMQALDEAGFRDDTLVVFLSDNGIAIPFAKCNVYLASTRTPWIVRWPGVVKPGASDRQHFISGIDFFPTVLEALDLPVPEGLDGTSFLPLLKGGSQEGRDMVFTQIDMKAGGDAVPMRCVQDEHYGYIYNAWSDGQHWYRNNNEGMTMKATWRRTLTAFATWSTARSTWRCSSGIDLDVVPVLLPLRACPAHAPIDRRPHLVEELRVHLPTADIVETLGFAARVVGDQEHPTRPFDGGSAIVGKAASQASASLQY